MQPRHLQPLLRPGRRPFHLHVGRVAPSCGSSAEGADAGSANLLASCHRSRFLEEASEPAPDPAFAATPGIGPRPRAGRRCPPHLAPAGRRELEIRRGLHRREFLWGAAGLCTSSATPSVDPAPPGHISSSAQACARARGRAVARFSALPLARSFSEAMGNGDNCSDIERQVISVGRVL
ncbi:unnamed protein product [Urochloa humidicola]